MKGQGATDRVRRLSATAVAERVAGPHGSGPHLVTWGDIAEADRFLRAHSSFGARPLDPAGRDGYVIDVARIGVEPGVPDPPVSEAKLPLPLPIATAKAAADHDHSGWPAVPVAQVRTPTSEMPGPT